MKRSVVRMVAVALICVASSSASAAVLVEDGFDGAASVPPDAAKFEWGGEAAQNGAGQLSLQTWAANRSWLRSRAGAAPGLDRTLVLQLRAYAYAENWSPGVYGDRQPRGLRIGADANNVAEFYSASRTSVGMRVRKDGAESSAVYALPVGVDSMRDYEISVTTTSVCFRVDGTLAATFTTHLPTGVLNLYVCTDDGGAGNVPVSIDSLSLSLTESPVVGVPPGITEQPASLTVNVTSNATFSVTATGTQPLGCQWMQDGANVNEATNASLTLLNVQPNQAGNYTVVITNAWGSATSRVAVLTVNRLTQTISFGSLPNKRMGAMPFALSAKASSGLPVSYTSFNPAVATVSGNTVTITGIGDTTIMASQGGMRPICRTASFRRFV